MDDREPWLSTRQQQVWRRWLHVNARLQAELHRGLQTDSGLSLPDFEVLVQLTDAPTGRVRVSDLADALQWERSRVSHHVTRMERRGLVGREECPEDGRGAFVAITRAGRSAIERAAPAHAATVKDLVFSTLTDEELASLDAVTTKIADRLDADRTAADLR